MAPIRFAFGLHLHQPVGNFDHVFAQHVDDVYRPLIDALAGSGFLPIVLHLSGPLFEWLEAHCTRDVSLLFHSKTVSANWAVPEFSKVRALPTTHHQVNVDSSVRRSAA